MPMPRPFLPPRPLLLSLFLAWPAAFPAHALDLPDLGEISRATLSDSQEGRIGREVMRQIRDSGDYLDDPVLLAYLDGLGDRLAEASQEPGRRFEFFAVRDPSINAFALPGGYIGVHTGLLSAVRDESELAGVLAHEIAHVTQKHIARIVDAQRSSSLTSMLALAVAILAARSNSQVSQAAMATAQALSLQTQLDFTRENEREADRVGLQTLGAAGFAPQGMATFFERLQAQGRLYENNAPAYLRTHPLTFERIADMQNRLAELSYRQHEDSPEFRYVRARVQAEEGSPADAVARFEARLKTQDEGAAKAESHYALARAALRDNDTARARAAYAALARYDAGQALSSPLVALLNGELLLAEKKAREAAAATGESFKRHPGYRPLAYLHARALLRAGRPGEALDFLVRQQRFWAADTQFQRLAAESYQALGQAARAHLAQAEVYVLEDRIGPAIEQLQLAQGQRGTDFYTQSIIDARLRELKERQAGEALR
ncbi:MAG: M48 family metalloprotease [Pseudomonadota bacterium]